MQEDDESIGIPEWVVTFGDMMSLLLTFFIMLVSMSEVKEEEKYQAMVESMHKRFGHDLSPASVSPGDHMSRSSELRVLSTIGRAKKKDTHKGGVPTKAPVGENERVRIVRPGGNTAIGTVVFFNDGAVELSEEGEQALDEQAKLLSGKPQKIEVRGHTAQQLASQGPAPVDAMDLAYRRCRQVMLYLTEKHAIPPERIRLSTAGAWEPMYLSSDPDKTRLNPRVEVFLLEETVDQLIGTVQERNNEIVENPTAE
jgi:chemotaxis protein MotB